MCPPPDPSWRIRSAPIAITLAVWVAASGGWLALHFRPDPGTAHAVVAAIQDSGWDRVRALHHWAAVLMIVALAFALGRRWLRGLVAPQDRLVWWGGLVVYGLLVVGFLGGRILAWDQHGWALYQQLAGLMGAQITDPNRARLTLVYALHLAVLPLIALVAIPVLHRRAAAERARNPAAAEGQTGRRSRLAAVALATVVALGLALFFPVGHGRAPTPGGGAGLSPNDWPVLWLVPFARLWGDAGMLLAGAFAAGLAFGAPAVADRMRARDRLYALLGVVGLWAGLTFLGLS